jgi:hypothetical protein
MRDSEHVKWKVARSATHRPATSRMWFFFLQKSFKAMDTTLSCTETERFSIFHPFLVQFCLTLLTNSAFEDHLPVVFPSIRWARLSDNSEVCTSSQKWNDLIKTKHSSSVSHRMKITSARKNETAFSALIERNGQYDTLLSILNKRRSSQEISNFTFPIVRALIEKPLDCPAPMRTKSGHRRCFPFSIGEINFESP